MAFEIVDMGFWVFYLGLKVTGNLENRTIKLSQPGYIEKILDCYGMSKPKTATVLVQNTILSLSNTPIFKLEKAKYAAKVGSIMYVILQALVDITFATFMVTQYVKNPSLEHFNMIDPILQYFAENVESSITFGRNEELKLISFLGFD